MTAIERSRESGSKGFEQMALYFRALGDPVRLRLIDALQSGEKTVSELVALVSSTQPNVSKHLRILAERGIVRRERRSKSVFYNVVVQVKTKADSKPKNFRIPLDLTDANAPDTLARAATKTLSGR